MLRRELAIVLRARLTWLQAALSALLVGHGFVLAVDLFSAGSRAVKGSVLMAREFDPLLGIVRPTLGGVYLAVSLLGPLVAVRALSVEKERRTLNTLLLQTASPGRLLVAKFLAALLGVGLQAIGPLLLMFVWLVVGGHLALGETLVAASAYLLYMMLVTASSIAASAWTRTLAQAATVALLVIAGSWAIDAADGFAALAWLGRVLEWSVTTHLYPMERGTIALGAVLWMLVMTAGALVLGWVGMNPGYGRTRVVRAAFVIVVAIGAGALAHRVPAAFDATESARRSLPPAAAHALQAIPGPVTIELALDRDDARRRQIESDLIAKLRLARSDVHVLTPLDQQTAPVEGERDGVYGKVVVRAGGGERETYSTSRKEIVTLLFEAAGRQLPAWSQPDYAGYPLVVEGARRTAVLVIAYLGIPIALSIAGWMLTRTRRRRLRNA